MSLHEEFGPRAAKSCPCGIPSCPEELSPSELAYIAKGLLLHKGGFTIDEKGVSAYGDLWAVSVAGKEQRYPGSPSVDEIVAYIRKTFPLSAAHFGGWYDRAENTTYLDHTEVYCYKHTAVRTAIRNGQKAIFNLQTGEEFRIPQGKE